MISFEEILNKRLTEHTKELNIIVMKSKEILTEITQIQAENVQLKREVNELNDKVSKLEEERENINLYSRRDCLEFHGIPQKLTVNADKIIVCH